MDLRTALQLAEQREIERKTALFRAQVIVVSIIVIFVIAVIVNL